MATIKDVRRIALMLPGAVEGTGEQFSIGVLVKGKHKGFVWAWRERIDPKKARVINENVMAVRVPNLTAKDALIATDPDKFFTEPHYDGYAAVLVRLSQVSDSELDDLLKEAWSCTNAKPK